MKYQYNGTRKVAPGTEIPVQTAPSAGGTAHNQLTKEQSDELQHLTKVQTALDQYNRIRDADKILAEGTEGRTGWQGSICRQSALLQTTEYRRVP